VEFAQVLLTIVVILLVIVVITTVLRAVRIVQQATAVIIERLGKYQKTLGAGLHFLVPFIDRPGPRSTCGSRSSASRRSR
jgi:regulator of protease activity HflC (stomatin/prohibitin superfamily)